MTTPAKQALETYERLLAASDGSKTPVTIEDDLFIRTALTASSQAWQDISTAPRDGTWILITNTSNWGGKYRKVREARWNKRDSSWGPFTTSNSITHWMPLPPPPVKDALEGGG